MIGFASGRIAAAPANLALIKQISIIGVRAGAYGRVYPAGGAAVNRAVLDYANKQGFRPLVHTRVPFEDVPAAFDMLTERRSIGRIVGMP